MLHVQPFTFNPLAENTYILYTEGGDCAIVDPGCYSASEEASLSAFITSHGLRPSLLINTHCHLDHVFGNRYVQCTWGLELHLHRAEEYVLSFAPATGEKWNLPFDPYDGPLHFIDEGDVLQVGSEALRILFTPGHSPGSVSFHSAAHKFVVSGDVLFERSIGRTDLPGGNFETLSESIRTKLYTLPADTIVYPGHGDSTTVGDELKGNPFVRME